MNKTEILAFIKENPIAFLATIDGSQPRVRGMDTFRADENGFIFYTNVTKDVSKQIEKNPDVEACYFAKGTQVRITGRLERVRDTALINEIVEKRPFLKPAVEANGLDYMAIYRLKSGKATDWSMQDMAAPKTFINL